MVQTQLPKLDKLDGSWWTVHTEPSPIPIHPIIPICAIPHPLLSKYGKTHIVWPVSRSALQPIAMMRELVSLGPKLRSALLYLPAHVPYLIHLTNIVHRFVETTYNLDLGPAQVTQLNKAISNGAEKGTFYLPKGTPVAVSARHPFTFSVQVFPDALSSPRRLLRTTTLTLKR